ncbi:B12-binding domain-containing radical SAM protein [Nanoarchaeota archaeon]
MNLLRFCNIILKNNSNHNITVLDLNLEFHNLKFKTRFKTFNNYEDETKEFHNKSKDTYSKNNLKVVKGQNPELFKELLDLILKHKPDLVAFSVVYSSQPFYTYALIKKLKELNIKTIVGGPSISHKLIEESTYLKDEIELLNYLKIEPKTNNKILDFNIYNLDKYFSPITIIPIKTSNSCYYKQCAFCTHHNKNKYKEYPIKDIIETIIQSKQKYFFLIDDMISKPRLLKLAQAFKPLNISWTCQLHPNKDLDKETLIVLKESGLKMIMWGVESGSPRILKLMNKMTTDPKIIGKTLKDSHDAGIKNIAYIIFGFPSETKEEFIETIDFLKENDKSLDLVSTSIFGLQSNSVIYNNPDKYNIKIIKEPRTILDPKISYETSEGLTQKEAVKLRDKYKKSIENINKYPKIMNYFREHMLCLL